VARSMTIASAGLIYIDRNPVILNFGQVRSHCVEQFTQLHEFNVNLHVTKYLAHPSQHFPREWRLCSIGIKCIYVLRIGYYVR